jgi:hypothetical protein
MASRGVKFRVVYSCMTIKQNPWIRVSLCYQLNKERRCVCVNKEMAYKLRKEIEAQNGTIYWFQPVE